MAARKTYSHIIPEVVFQITIDAYILGQKVKDYKLSHESSYFHHFRFRQPSWIFFQTVKSHRRWWRTMMRLTHDFDNSLNNLNLKFENDRSENVAAKNVWNLQLKKNKMAAMTSC